MRQTKEVKLGDTEYKISEVPPIEAQEFKLIELAQTKYRIGKMSLADTREVVMTYPISLAPKIGDYKKNEEMFYRLMKYVEVNIGNQWVRLDNPALVEQWVKPMDSFVLEKEVIDLTTGFFSSGKFQDFTADVITYLLQNVIGMLMESLEQLSQKEKQV